MDEACEKLRDSLQKYANQDGSRRGVSGAVLAPIDVDSQDQKTGLLTGHGRMSFCHCAGLRMSWDSSSAIWVVCGGVRGLKGAWRARFMGFGSNTCCADRSGKAP